MLQGCKTAQPKAPEAGYLPSFERIKEISSFNIPVEVPVADLERQVNAAVPTLIFEDNSLENNDNDNLMLKVTRRAPLKVEAQNGIFNYTVPVHIWAKAGWKIEKFGVSLSKYEDTDFDIDVRFSTRLGADENWNVTTATTANGYNWVSKPFLNIGGFKIPIKIVIDEILQKQQPVLAQTIDQAAKGKLNLRQYVSTAWKAMQVPIELNHNYKVWLKITPTELSYAPFTSGADKVRTLVGLKAYTETFIGDAPAQAAVSEIPVLKTIKSGNDKTQIGLIASLPFSEASAIAFNQVKGKKYDFSNGKKQVEIMALEIYGQNDKVIVMAELSGSYNGKIWLRGKPVWDAKLQSLKFAELDFDLDTKDKLLKSANWLAHGTIVQKISPYFDISLAGQMADARKKIADNLANNKINDKITVKGSLDDLKPDAIYITPTGFQAVILATGKLEVFVSGF
ncbi:MAG: DUF4403 family protein [Bacteroidota bacterium]